MNETTKAQRVSDRTILEYIKWKGAVAHNEETMNLALDLLDERAAHAATKAALEAAHARVENMRAAAVSHGNGMALSVMEAGQREREMRTALAALVEACPRVLDMLDRVPGCSVEGCIPCRENVDTVATFKSAPTAAREVLK